MKHQTKVSTKAPQAKNKKLAKKRPEKFRIVSRVSPTSPLFFATFIDWKQKPEPLLVSVARSSGSAVMRNRWKRIIKEWFYSEGLKTIPGQSIWIRYNRTKLLKKPLHYQDWANMLNIETSRLKAARVT
jgi:ribonuclease P protein component